jgi:hypothetical protein
VFADGFTLVSASAICPGDHDDYELLDILDSLVRKSLLAVERTGRYSRYRMLETIRQYGEDQIAERSSEVRDRHAAYFAAEAVRQWEKWDGPDQRETLDWVDIEFSNLRAGFHWSMSKGDAATATAIAAHTALLALSVQRHEAVTWAEELLPPAVHADVAMLPRLYTAAGLCSFTGRPDQALNYLASAQRLEAGGRHNPFVTGVNSFFQEAARRFSGDTAGAIERSRRMAAGSDLERAFGMSWLLYALPNAARGAEARMIADDTLTAMRAYGNPWIIAFTMDGYGRAFAETEPARALCVLRDGLAYARKQRLAIFEAFFVRDAAALALVCGDLTEALELFLGNLDALQRAGDVAHLASTLGEFAVLLARIDRPVPAATIYGATARHFTMTRVVDLPRTIDGLRIALGPAQFDNCLAEGATMELAEAAQYARQQILLARARDPSTGM